MKIALLVAVSLAAALVMLRGRALRRWAAFEVSAWLLFGVLGAVAKPLGVSVEPELAFITFAVLKLAPFFAIVAFSKDVRWSANRAAIVALLLYGAAIPPMLTSVIDGDEPYYLLVTESLVRDHDLDLANQYRDLAHSAAGRTDLKPQLGDPVGPHGEKYSRHELFLSILLIPGYLAGGLPGCVAIMAVFGALLARSTIRLFEDEGISDDTARALFPLVAFGPPIVFYATRIWPEVPAALCFVEAIRGIRQRRPMRWLPSLAALVLLKLRFLLVAILLLLRVVPRWRRGQARLPVLLVGGALLMVPLAIAFVASGNLLGTHGAWELLPGQPYAYLLGLFGLPLDAAAGIAFQAPLYLFGLVALARWKRMPPAFRIGMSSALFYVIFLIPRVEWHGGWSPPLRYVVFLFPILALGVAALWEKIAAAPLAMVTLWTIALVIHGLVYPWRLFHIANGESSLGEWLSSMTQTDFSRLLPSFIRPNFAALVASLLLIVFLVVFRSGRTLTPAVAAALVAMFFLAGTRPGSRIDFEDAHVMHHGGEPFPAEFQPLRFLYQGGWIVRGGDSLSFLAKRGHFTLRYESASGATIQLGTTAYVLPPARTNYSTIGVDVPRDGRIELQCLSGSANLDRMTHD